MSLFLKIVLICLIIFQYQDVNAGDDIFQNGFEAYRVTVSVTGLEIGLPDRDLEVQLNGSENLLLEIDGDFSFSTFLLNGTVYEVSITEQPLNGPPCNLMFHSGTINESDVTVIAQCLMVNQIYPSH